MSLAVFHCGKSWTGWTSPHPGPWMKWRIFFRRNWKQAELEAKNADFTDTAALEEKYESLKAELLETTRVYDSLLEKLHDILRKNGATEAQLTWNIYSNVEMNLLTGRKYYKVAEELYRKTLSILYYLAFLQVLNQYRNPDTEELTELNHIRKHYKVVVY